MTVDKSWRLGQPGSPIYRLYDWLRMRLNRFLVDYLTAQLETKRRSIVLEAGSGTGYASSLVAEHSSVALSIALDYDIEALSQARQRDPGLPLVVADLRALPFRAGSIDLVWNSSTLEHLPAIQPALAEISRVVRPGGAVFVGVPNRSGPLGFQRWMADSAAGIWIGTVFDRKTLETAFREAALEPYRSITYFLRFFVGVFARKS